MSMQESSVRTFSEQLASKAAVPGGGGASALAGALGIALGDMVGELTVGKKKYADVEEEIKGLMEEAQQLRRTLLACIDEDAAAFEPLSRAYGIPKDDPSRDAVLEECLRAAAMPPMHILEACCRAVELLEEFAVKGSALMISDAATGAALCRGALQGAAVNVRVNTRLMKDRSHAEELNARVNALTEEYAARAERVYEAVAARLS